MPGESTIYLLNGKATGYLNFAAGAPHHPPWRLIHLTTCRCLCRRSLRESCRWRNPCCARKRKQSSLELRSLGGIWSIDLTKDLIYSLVGDSTWVSTRMKWRGNENRWASNMLPHCIFLHWTRIGGTLDSNQCCVAVRKEHWTIEQQCS